MEMENRTEDNKEPEFTGFVEQLSQLFERNITALYRCARLRNHIEPRDSLRL